MTDEPSWASILGGLGKSHQMRFTDIGQVTISSSCLSYSGTPQAHCLDGMKIATANNFDMGEGETIPYAYPLQYHPPQSTPLANPRGIEFVA